MLNSISSAQQHGGQHGNRGRQTTRSLYFELDLKAFVQVESLSTCCTLLPPQSLLVYLPPFSKSFICWAICHPVFWITSTKRRRINFTPRSILRIYYKENRWTRDRIFPPLMACCYISTKAPLRVRRLPGCFAADITDHYCPSPPDIQFRPSRTIKIDSPEVFKATGTSCLHLAFKHLDTVPL